MSDGMFPAPDPPPIELSQHFSNPVEFDLKFQYGDKLSWRKHEMKKFTPCEECQWFKHEHHGNALPNRQIHMRRTLVRGNTTVHVDLCNVHASMWKQRDGVSS